MLFLIGFGGTYGVIKKLVPGDAIQLQYWTKTLFLMFFVVAFFAIYPWIWAKFNLHDIDYDLFVPKYR